MFTAAVIVLIVTIFLVYASGSVSAGVYLRCLCRNKRAGDSVALTFDDGPDPVLTPKVLDVLKRHGAKATFFLIGSRAARHPEIIQRIVAEGHSIGNHSYHHRWSFPLKSVRSIRREISMCRQELDRSAGRPIRLFRPPFGVTNPMVGRAVKKEGAVAVGWSVRSYDTMGWNIDRVKKRVLRRLRPGDVLLLHDDRPNADLLLEGILSELNTRQWRSVTINELFNT